MRLQKTKDSKSKSGCLVLDKIYEHKENRIEQGLLEFNLFRIDLLELDETLAI